MREIGWKVVEFAGGIVAPCVMCGNLVSKGIVQLKDVGREGEAGFRVMCVACRDDVFSSGSEAELLEKRRARATH